MSFRFVNKPLEYGIYEPEGIYLDSPLERPAKLVQQWGSGAKFYSQYQYNGVALKGYIGIGFEVDPNSAVLAMDQGRVSEINFEPTGFERYIKIDHWWGESLYARVNVIRVESGQLIGRNTPLAIAGKAVGKATGPFSLRFHLGIRIRPYNRFDGWGGFSDPLPFLNPEAVGNSPIVSRIDNIDVYPPLPMANEKGEMRRP